MAVTTTSCKNPAFAQDLLDQLLRGARSSTYDRASDSTATPAILSIHTADPTTSDAGTYDTSNPAESWYATKNINRGSGSGKWNNASASIFSNEAAQQWTKRGDASTVTLKYLGVSFDSSGKDLWFLIPINNGSWQVLGHNEILTMAADALKIKEL